MEKLIYEYELDGKKIALHKDSVIEVQIGKNSSSYKTRYTFKGNEFGKAVFHYNGINIGNGFKKRLKCDSLNKPILARQIS